MKTPIARTIFSIVATTLLAFTQTAVAVDYTLDQASCELTFAGTWTTGVVDLCTVADLQVNAGDKLRVAASTTLNLAGTSTVHEADIGAGLAVAQLDIDAGARLEIDGTLINEGVVDISGTTQVNGAFTNVKIGASQGIVELDGTLTNNGTLANNGLWVVFQTGVIESFVELKNLDYGTFSNLGTVTVLAGSMSNYHHMVNSGGAAILSIWATASFENLNAGTQLMNFGGGRIGNKGTLVNGLGAELTNDGSFLANTYAVINYGDAFINNENNGLIVNIGATGVIENQNGGIIRNRAMIHNIGLIENYCSATFTNFATGIVSNVAFVGRFDNFGGTITNLGIFNLPPVQQGCVFKP